MPLGDIDHLLIDAWLRLSGDAQRLRWTERRRLRPVLRRPPRAWCLAIRASDTRLEAHASSLDVASGDNLSPEELELYARKHRGVSGRRTIVSSALLDADADALGIAPQKLILSGAGISALTAPVRIYEPTPINEAAAMLGVTDAPLRRWVIRGALKCRHELPPGGAGGPPRVLVWSAYPLDPNRYHGRAPDPSWGDAWLSLGQRIAADYEATFIRTAMIRRVRGKLRNMGWTWVCPGRLMRDPTDSTGVSCRHTGCGRTARTLFGPIPVWTLAQHLAHTHDHSVSPGDAHDALLDPFNLTSPLNHVPLSFACDHCWQPQRTSGVMPDAAWNLFVTHLSGGLLHGADVPRPAGAFESPARNHLPHHPPRTDGLPLAGMPKPVFIVPWYKRNKPAYDRQHRIGNPLKKRVRPPKKSLAELRDEARVAAQKLLAEMSSNAPSLCELDAEFGQEGFAPIPSSGSRRRRA